jgi:hypothetical protein
MGAIVEVKYFNSFWMKQVQGSVSSGSSNNPKWPGIESNPYGYPAFPNQAVNSLDNWYIEEARIKGGYNNTIVSPGVRAYLNEKNPIQDVRESSLIYSGVYNSRTDINRTNVFSIAESLTIDADPSDGSIQKLFAEDTNLVVFQENKVSKALINKNTIYSGNQGATETSKIPVIGQIVPYLGRFGIGKNPESFAEYGFRKYFADPIRGSVMRLSRDGLTEISNYGMKDYFRDSLGLFDSNYKTQNISWTKSTNPPRSIKDGVEVLAAGLDLTNYTFLNPGTTANIQVTSNNAGINAEVVVVTASQSVVQINTTSIGGSGYRVGDIITVPGDGVNFSGSISLTLTSAELNTLTGSLNPFYVEGVNACDIFLGSEVLNLQANGSTTNTGVQIIKVETVNTNPTILAITTNGGVTPDTSGFFAYQYKSKIVGGWDNYSRYYTLSMQGIPSNVEKENNFATLSYDEGINGWVSRYSYKPGFIFSLKGDYFSTYDNSLYSHYSNNTTGTNYLNYYGVRYTSNITFIVNANPSTKKNFQTINYEGDNGWQVTSINSDVTKFNNNGVGTLDIGNIISSFNEGLYIDPNSGYPKRAGFERKENLFVANINNQSRINFEEIIGGSLLTGLKGYLMTVTMNVDTSTNVGGKKSLWSVGTTFKQSS